MRVLDLFSGMGGWHQAFRDADVVAVELNKDLPGTMTNAQVVYEDIRNFKWWEYEFDVVLASPPCTSFSVASIGKHWGGGHRAYQPKTDAALLGMDLVKKTVEIIEGIDPAFAIIENPRGVLRKLDLIPYHRYTVTYCQYGETRMKPTDLWVRGTAPYFRPMCKNGAPCHERAPRGAKTGTQGLKNNAIRSIIPRELSEAIYHHCKNVRVDGLRLA